MSLVDGFDSLRLFLLAGLVAHKVLWEAMKRGSRPPARRNTGILLQGVKIAKALFLVGLIIQTLFLQVLPLSADPALPRLVGSAFFLIGLATAMSGRVQLGRNWKDVEDIATARQESLTTRGIYGYIRHPIYAGDMLLLIGLELALNSWLVLAMIVPILVFAKQAVAEESLLAGKFQGYSSYAARTKRFIPFLI
ncbi:MAG: methyltransferase family protein [Rudaea sp.]